MMEMRRSFKANKASGLTQTGLTFAILGGGLPFYILPTGSVWLLLDEIGTHFVFLGICIQLFSNHDNRRNVVCLGSIYFSSSILINKIDPLLK
jgi:hypothetical protein